MASYALHRLIQSFCRNPNLVERLKENFDAVCAEYGVPEPERAALRTPSPEAFGAAGIHPILQVHLMLALDPGFGAKLNPGPFLDRIKAL